jgi:hypothetical protein
VPRCDGPFDALGVAVEREVRYHAPFACAVGVIRWGADMSNDASAVRSVHRLRA